MLYLRRFVILIEHVIVYKIVYLYKKISQSLLQQNLKNIIAKMYNGRQASLRMSAEEMLKLYDSKVRIHSSND